MLISSVFSHVTFIHLPSKKSSKKKPTTLYTLLHLSLSLDSSTFSFSNQPMDEFYFRKSHVPAFGSWDCNNNDNLPFTECFESARQAGLFRYSYSEDRDLYVAGDLYDNDIVTPAMIVVPRHCRMGKKGSYGGDAKKDDAVWVVPDHDESTDSGSPPSSRRVNNNGHCKAVDEDLYKISPELLRAHTKKQQKKRSSWCLFSCCLQPTCVR